MEVILLEKVDNLGDLGERVHVRAGYGRNYLLPKGKATMASEENIKLFEQRRAELEKTAQEALAAAQARREQLEGMTVTITAKAGEEGKLFGSIGPADIAEALGRAGVEVEKKELRMPGGLIRVTGEYEVVVHLHTDVEAAVKVAVEAE
ncbi:MAG: 50S ribosomal protein L9 [Gammaproteobacteria bacterium]|nr:50S ribosomal protein L9 [Gammaproteobacteria bacterium]NIR99184.1 50S ribosomal protein L9 [Gammaproteobacteria bacterium]NIT64808.1 50S ribosomal protein L9 [Gammaproteobacteria bacterium]NIV21770.1 50S ribosomal protein L9 [Gammaproteobacteria bacterium]NIX10783.1 50S ribosomal protein L9 [Gammaproteobacteria bacterium]